VARPAQEQLAQALPGPQGLALPARARRVLVQQVLLVLAPLVREQVRSAQALQQVPARPVLACSAPVLAVARWPVPVQLRQTPC